MSQSAEANVAIPTAQLASRLRELQGIWAEANPPPQQASPAVVPTTGDSPRFTPTKPQTPPRGRSPRTYHQRSRETLQPSPEGSQPAPVESSAGTLPSVRSSAGSAAGMALLTSPSRPPRESDACDVNGAAGAVCLPSLSTRASSERTCAGCGHLPPRASAKFCAYCGRRLSQM